MVEWSTNCGLRPVGARAYAPEGAKLMENRKKKAAAISAVMSYIKTEEEAFSLQPIAAADHAPYSSAPVQLKLWGISGRQAQMQMRNLMQMKAFHRIK